MFDTLKMIVYKFNEQKKELRHNLKQFFYRHDFSKKKHNMINITFYLVEDGYISKRAIIIYN